MVSGFFFPQFPRQHRSSSHRLASTSCDNGSHGAALRVVVVGAGIGGLAVAARIAASQPSCDVTVVEKNEHIGGRSGSFHMTIPNLGAFRHERGPSLLLLPHVYHELFHDVANRTKPAHHVAEDFGLVIRQCTPAYQVVFDDGDRLNVGFSKRLCDADDSVAALYQESRNKMDSLEANGAAKWDDYMRAMSAFLDCGFPNFIEERLDLASFPAFIKEALKEFGRLWPLKPHSDVLDAIFDSEKMRALASFQDLYVGLEPFKNKRHLFGGVLKSTAPAVFGLLAAIELHPDNKKAGVFAPIGGFRAVSESIAKLAQSRGVAIETGKTVTSISSNGVHVINNTNGDNPSHATNGTTSFMPADLVIVNADLPYASRCLVEASANRAVIDPEEPRFDWDDSFMFSSGVVAFHWSINKELNDLNTHNVFLAAALGRAQAEESWRVLRVAEKHRQDATATVEPFNFYVHRATATDPSAAPQGCDSIMVLVPCPTLQRNPTYASLPRDEAIQKYNSQFGEGYISSLRQAVLKRLSTVESLADLERHILDEVVDTPATYADQYHVGAGTPFALSHGFAQLSLTRPGPNFGLGKSNKNILYCGASSRPGNGVPLVLTGSKLVSQRALSVLKELARVDK